MSTRARIGYIDQEHNQVVSVYLHFDGYPSRVMPILEEYFNSLIHIKHLIKYGDISVLNTTIETCKFYTRDLEEDPEDTAPKRISLQADNAKDALISWSDSIDIDHFYLFDPNHELWLHKNT